MRDFNATEWNPDPIEQEADGWYFYDEAWCARYGPFPSEAIARENLRRYCQQVLGECGMTRDLAAMRAACEAGYVSAADYVKEKGMTIRIVDKKPDVFVSESELRRYKADYQRDYMYYAGTPPTLEDYIRRRKRDEAEGHHYP